MDIALIQKLSEYCDQLIGETTESESIKKAKKRSKILGKHEVSKDLDKTPTSLHTSSCKKKKKKTVLNEETNETTDNENAKKIVGSDKELETDNDIAENINVSRNSNIECTQNNIYNTNTKEVGEQTKQSINSLLTDDGFKIVSSIPEDDSDISDAFESDIGEEEEDLAPQTKHALKPRVSPREVKTTEDGFKIISDIPPDDSDVSDAFTDEEDDDESDSMGGELLTRRKQPTSEKTLSKPILQMMDDFGLGENMLKRKQPEIIDKQPETVSAVRNSKKKTKLKGSNNNTTTLAAKRKPQVDVTVIDYSQKRGTTKGESTKESVVNDPTMFNTKEKLEKDLKRMRFEIFKLGMAGFEKQKKKETRIALAVRLGAKPSKKEYVKYKDLLVTKHQEKKEEKEKDEMNREMGMKKKKRFQKPKDKKKPRAYSAQVGRFSDGVLSLSKKDMAKIKRS